MKQHTKNLIAIGTLIKVHHISIPEAREIWRTYAGDDDGNYISGSYENLASDPQYGVVMKELENKVVAQ